MLPLIVGSVAVGIVVGILSGMLGIGGGTILVPVFRLLFGLPPIAATATSLFTVIPTSASGMVSHIKGRTCIPLLGIAAGLGGALLSPVGVWLASISPDWAIMVAAALVIGYSAVTMFIKAMKLRKARAKSDALSGLPADEGFSPNTDGDPNADAKAGGSDPMDASLEDISLPPKGRLFGIGFAIGLAAGLMSGYVGVGGGFLMIPLFMQLLGTPMKLTSGTSLIAVMFIAIPGTVMQAILGNVEWVAGIMVAIGAIPGAVIGSKLMKRVPEFALRLGFSVFLLIAAILLVVNQLNVA